MNRIYHRIITLLFSMLFFGCEPINFGDENIYLSENETNFAYITEENEPLFSVGIFDRNSINQAYYSKFIKQDDFSVYPYANVESEIVSKLSKTSTGYTLLLRSSYSKSKLIGGYSTTINNGDTVYTFDENIFTFFDSHNESNPQIFSTYRDSSRKSYIDFDINFNSTTGNEIALGTYTLDMTGLKENKTFTISSAKVRYPDTTKIFYVPDDLKTSSSTYKGLPIYEWNYNKCVHYDFKEKLYPASTIQSGTIKVQKTSNGLYYINGSLFYPNNVEIKFNCYSNLNQFNTEQEVIESSFQPDYYTEVPGEFY